MPLNIACLLFRTLKIRNRAARGGGFNPRWSINIMRTVNRGRAIRERAPSERHFNNESKVLVADSCKLRGRSFETVCLITVLPGGHPTRCKHVPTTPRRRCRRRQSSSDSPNNMQSVTQARSIPLVQDGDSNHAIYLHTKKKTSTIRPLTRRHQMTPLFLIIRPHAHLLPLHLYSECHARDIFVFTFS